MDSHSPWEQSDDLPVAGIELGGTKCICTLGFGPNRIISQNSIDTGHPEATLGALHAILDGWSQQIGFRALGVASFGPICLNPGLADYGHILSTTKTDWSNVDVLGGLSAGFEVPTGFDTDVNGAAIAEIAWGCGKGLTDFAYVTVGTGIGVGLIVNGQPTRGIGHSELGHMLVSRMRGDEFEGACVFHADCVEGLASGLAIEHRLGAEHVGDIATDNTLWDPVVDALAKLSHNLVCAAGPQRIAFGGGVISRQPHLIPRIEARLIESLGGYMTLPAAGSYVVAPMLGVQAGPLGSLALAIAAEHAPIPLPAE